MNEVMEAVKSKKDPFKWWKVSPSEMNKRKHRLWKIE